MHVPVGPQEGSGFARDPDHPQTRLTILNSPGDPTGGVVDREHVSLLDYASIHDRLIVLNGPSKTHAMPGWRRIVDQARL